MAMYVNSTAEQEAREERMFAAAAMEERRRAERTKRKFVTQVTPWAPGVPSVPFDVVIEDISDTGAGLVHDQPLSIGVPHLLTVPRGDEGRSIIREYIVIRCAQRPDGKYSIDLEASLARGSSTISATTPAKRVMGKNIKLLFLALGVVGLLAATFIPLN
jgi:hypothetical protein